MFGGIYYGAMYGGSTTSILLNTPGETGAIATAIDGHQMARQGRAAAALTTAAIGSFVAGTLATIALTFFAPVLASVALSFGPAEYFALTMLAFCGVTALLGSSLVRGLFSLFLGLALGLVGIDQLTGDCALLVRHPAASRRHRRRDPRDRSIRGRRNALPGVASRTRRARGRGATRLDRHESRRVAALVASVAARHRDRLSARRAADGRVGDPDIPVVHRREAAELATRGVRPGRDRGGCRSRSCEQRRGRRRARTSC